MAKRRPPSVPDWHLWSEVTRTVTPLRRSKTDSSHDDEPLPTPQTVAPAVPAAPRLRRIVRPEAPTRPSPTIQPLPQARRHAAAIEPRTRRRLMRGQIELDGTLDLHGMRQVEAHAALTRFLHARSGRGDRTVLVITGKGLKKLEDDAATIIERGVLRSMLPLWLSEPGLAPLVSGWDFAAQGHGGEGAFYVRLKRSGR
jgi:DNA-nicking Smr family endonuclease